MATGFAPTFLACGGIFLLSFFMIWAFWFVERLRGASAPQLGTRADGPHPAGVCTSAIGTNVKCRLD
jgi:hypothetical protein